MQFSQLPNLSDILALLCVSSSNDIQIIDSMPSRGLYLLSSKKISLRGLIIEVFEDRPPRYFCEPPPYSFELSYDDFENKIIKRGDNRYSHYTNLQNEEPFLIRAAYSNSLNSNHSLNSSDNYDKEGKWIFSSNKKIDAFPHIQMPDEYKDNKNMTYVFQCDVNIVHMKVVASYIRSGVYFRRLKECNTGGFNNTDNPRRFESSFSPRNKKKPFLYYNPINGFSAKVISKETLEQKYNNLLQFQYLSNPIGTVKEHPSKKTFFEKIEKDIRDLPYYIAECYRKRYFTRNFTKLHPEEYHIITQVHNKFSQKYNSPHYSQSPRSSSDTKSLLYYVSNELKSSTSKQIHLMLLHMHESAANDIE